MLPGTLQFGLLMAMRILAALLERAGSAAGFASGQIAVGALGAPLGPGPECDCQESPPVGPCAGRAAGRDRHGLGMSG